MADPLSNDQVAQELNDLPEWTHENDTIKREFSFKDFPHAISFITRIAFEAEDRVHHPEIFNVYNTVKISLSTHDAGGKVTEKDITLAKIIESLYNN